MSSALLLGASAVLGGALAAETIASRRDRRRHPPPGRRVDVGSHALHARVLGSGDPVIVLEAGAGEWSSHWDRLPDRLSELSTVIAYDRAGLGWSDPGPGPRTIETLTRELRELLRRLAAGRELVLVGHAAGAHVLRMFAHRYPFELGGLVFVDPYHEALAGELLQAAIPSPMAPPWMVGALAVAARLGILRAIGYSPLGAATDTLPLSASTLDTIRALGRSHRVLAGMLAEQREAVANDRTLAGLDDRLDVPVRILTAAASLPAAGTPSSYPREEFNRIWREVSARLANLSSRTQLRLVEDSDHFLALRSPQLVVDAVGAVLEAVREAPAS